jgi:hypothetical protein
MSEGNVTFISPEKYEVFALNGVVQTVAEGLNKFYGSVDDVPEDISVKVSNVVVSDRDMNLRAGDVVLIVDGQVASGGFKGA